MLRKRFHAWPLLAEAVIFLVCYLFVGSVTAGREPGSSAAVLALPILVMIVLPVVTSVRGVAFALRARRRSWWLAAAVIAAATSLAMVMTVVADHVAHWFEYWINDGGYGPPPLPWQRVHPGDCAWRHLWER